MYEHLLDLRQLPLLALDISCHISEIPLHDLVCSRMYYYYSLHKPLIHCITQLQSTSLYI